MTEQTKPRTSWQLCTAQGKPTKITIGNKPGFRVDYTRTDTETPEAKFINYFQGQFSKDQDSQKVLVGLDAGVEFVLVKEPKPNPTNPTAPFWNAKEFKTVDKWEERPVSTFSKWGNGTTGGGTYVKTGKSYDDTGVKVGAARNQAIAFLAANAKNGFTWDDVDRDAYAVIKRQAAQEATIRAEKTATNGIAAQTDAALAAENHNQALQREEEPVVTNNSEVPF